MKIFGLNRYAFSICVSVAMLAGCSGAQPPLGATRTLAHGVSPASSFKVLHDFNGEPDGDSPGSNLASLNGTVYGTTFYGGAHNVGTVYSISPDGAEKVLHSFGHHPDGIFPYAGVIHAGDKLYGTTREGGTSDRGTVYSISTDGTEKVLYSFSGGSDGAKPSGGVIDVNGTLYGTTTEGGTSDKGTVFSIGSDGTQKVLHSFGGGSDGATPIASLTAVEYSTTTGHYRLYGTTSKGGTSDKGTVFDIDIDGTEKVLHSFGGGSDGAHPEEALTAVHDKLYGTTVEGGTSDKGTVFSIDFNGTEKVLHSFGSGDDGSGPYASLTDLNGTLYGTTFLGGRYGCFRSGCGTVYSISTDGTEKVLFSFYGPDGEKPQGGLLHHNGKLYGTAAEGGTYGLGTVYEFTP